MSFDGYGRGRDPSPRLTVRVRRADQQHVALVVAVELIVAEVG